MKLFQTNSGLDYQELAFYLELDDNKHLCVALNFTPDTDVLFGCSHEVGKIETNLEKYELESTNFKISDADLTKVLGQMLNVNNLNIDNDILNEKILSLI